MCRSDVKHLPHFSHDVAIIHLSSSKEKGLQFKLRLTRPERYKLKVQGRDLCMFGQLYQGEKDETVNTKDYNPDKGLKYGARVRVLLPQGGRFSAVGDTALMIKDASEAVVIIALATDYYKDGPIETKLKNSLAAAETQSYEQLKREHEQAYAKWFGRVSVDFGEVDGRNEMPLDQRMDLFKKQGNDPSLIALYMQFGRYLLISSTRQGALPPNLQGLWCGTLTPEWSSDYHTNINLQMNLWPATTGNLSDLIYPTFDWMERLLPNARKTAWAYYHAKGWVNFHIGNVWQFTSPGMYPAWGSCVTLGAWMCTTLYNAFLYTNDKAYLAKLYPMLRECALFFTEILVEDPETHYLITAPTCSPENQYVYDGKNVGVCPGCTMDNQVLRDLFSKTMDAARILGKDEDFCKKLEALTQRLQPTTIAADGRIMEWMQPYQERPDAINFGHVSHLYGLYPSNEISWERTPDLAAAANKSIYVRGGYGHSGWCGAWRSLLCSRLHMGEDAYHFMTNLLTCEPETKDAPNWYPNTSYHQIDECFGGCASVMEMLIQSQNGFIDLLPALPAALKSGSFSGLVVRGGGEVSLVWKDKIVEKMSLTAKGDYTFRLKLKPYMDVKRFRLSGSPINTNFTGDILEVAMKKGEVLRYE